MANYDFLEKMITTSSLLAGFSVSTIIKLLLDSKTGHPQTTNSSETKVNSSQPQESTPGELPTPPELPTPSELVITAALDNDKHFKVKERIANLVIMIRRKKWDNLHTYLLSLSMILLITSSISSAIIWSWNKVEDVTLHPDLLPNYFNINLVIMFAGFFAFFLGIVKMALNWNQKLGILLGIVGFLSLFWIMTVFWGWF